MVDTKLTYSNDNLRASLRDDGGSRKLANDDIGDIVQFTGSAPTKELITLAYDSGTYSRFNTDQKLSENQFKAMYKAWIENSVNGKAADATYVIYENEKIIAMFTWKKINKTTGDIGLLAVSSDYRGQGLGRQSLEKAKLIAAQQSLDRITVVTQQLNVPACKLYESVGFQISRKNKFFHFHLDA